MNTALLLEIVELAVSLARRQGSGAVHDDLVIEDTLLEIVERSIQAYQEHTGETLDPDLIKAERPL